MKPERSNKEEDLEERHWTVKGKTQILKEVKEQELKDKREEHDLQRQQLLQMSSQFEAATTAHQQQMQPLQRQCNNSNSSSNNNNKNLLCYNSS